MDILLDVSRAAKLAGVRRERIQDDISSGRLSSFEGKVALSALKAVYTDVTVSRSDMIDYVAQLKENALAKSVGGERAPRTLAEARTRLEQAEKEREHFRLRAEGYLALLRSTARALESAAEAKQLNHRLLALNRWLGAKLRE